MINRLEIKPRTIHEGEIIKTRSRSYVVKKLDRYDLSRCRGCDILKRNCIRYKCLNLDSSGNIVFYYLKRVDDESGNR